MAFLTYEEVKDIYHLVSRDGEYPELANKLENILQDFWNPGTEMPPLNVAIVVKLGNGTELKGLKRKDLLPAYSGFEYVTFYDKKDNIIELASGYFKWRRL